MTCCLTRLVFSSVKTFKTGSVQYLALILFSNRIQIMRFKSLVLITFTSKNYDYAE